MRRTFGQLWADPEREIAPYLDFLARGGVVAIPTETFYGLASDPFSGESVTAIYALKGRSSEKALPVLIGKVSQLKELGVCAPDSVIDLLLGIWPAPLTAILPVTSPIAASGSASTLAVRMPAHADLLRFLEISGPLTGTSANRSGKPPESDPEQVWREFGKRGVWLIDDGQTPGGLPSTVIDFEASPPRLVRPGAYPWSGA
jgi:L-threonylcarbamoyladenylate synthase